MHPPDFVYPDTGRLYRGNRRSVQDNEGRAELLGRDDGMDIILPVAGLGTRLRPLTWSRPKPLVSVGGKPILAHVLDRVMPVNPDKIVFITGFLGEQVEAWANEQYDIPL